jgi:hypothetical protein
MAARTRADDHDSATDIKLYLPAGVSPPVEIDRLERLWGRLFSHGVEQSK